MPARQGFFLAGHAALGAAGPRRKARGLTQLHEDIHHHRIVQQ